MLTSTAISFVLTVASWLGCLVFDFLQIYSLILILNTLTSMYVADRTKRTAVVLSRKYSLHLQY
jgi:hypothetical protein